MLISSIDEASDVLRRIRESIRSFSTATFSKTNYLEVLPVGVNKAKALAVLTETLGFELSQVAAIGDAPNTNPAKKKSISSEQNSPNR
jgi:hydroxymethylpyrimidine pyrophosphatase-like HAD family hydrolase